MSDDIDVELLLFDGRSPSLLLKILLCCLLTLFSAIILIFIFIFIFSLDFSFLLEICFSFLNDDDDEEKKSIFIQIIHNDAITSKIVHTRTLEYNNNNGNFGPNTRNS